MKTLELSEATESLADYVRMARTETIVVTIKGKPMVALTAIGRNTDLENLIVSSDPAFRGLIERSRALFPAGSGLSTDEVRRQLGQSKKQGRRRTRRSAAARRRGLKG
jgi:antitoxin (DNA-binding transcriptional repressor) of toxin-antitoxin stability system